MKPTHRGVGVHSAVTPVRLAGGPPALLQAS